MRRLVAALAVILLVAAACGDDGEGGASSPFGGDDDLPDDIRDQVDDILGDIQSGDLDPEDIVADAENVAEDFLENFSSDGGGTVEVHGETIDFVAELCFAGQGDFTAEGLGAASDGTPVWVSISFSEDTREEMEEFMDENTVDLMFGDADVLINRDVTVDFGRDKLFASAPDDQPSFSASSSTGGFGGPGELEMDLDGSSASGSGQATDHNFVVGDFDDTFPISFSASCG